MEPLAYTKSPKTNQFQCLEEQSTPKERLHTVEEFIDKLELAVLERL